LAGGGGSGAVPASASYTIDPFSADSKETFLLGWLLFFYINITTFKKPGVDSLKTFFL